MKGANVEGNYLNFNIVNLITVVLMVAVGVFLIGGVTAAVKKATGTA